MGDEDLMELFMRLTVWSDYLSGLLALAEIDETDADARLSVYEAKYFAALKGEKVTDMRAERDADPDTIERRTERDEAKAYRKLMCALFDSSTRDAAAVSRELSRRIGTAELSRRTARWNP